MLTLHAYGTQIQCDYAEKGDDYIKIYKDGQVFREDSGISDFTGYVLTDENGNPVEFAKLESDNNAMNTAIRAVVMALSENGMASSPLSEPIIDRAIAIAHE